MPAARAPAALAAAGAFALLCCFPCAVSATNSTDVAVAVAAEGERGSVPLAFAFTIGAGLCTTVGGALSFLGDVEDKRILAVCLALSAGVMLYVSFVEIFVKSKDAMVEHFVEQVRRQHAVSAQKLSQVQPFLAVLPQECAGQLAPFGPA
jgi:hypothetical protein